MAWGGEGDTGKGGVAGAGVGSGNVSGGSGMGGGHHEGSAADIAALAGALADAIDAGQSGGTAGTAAQEDVEGQFDPSAAPVGVSTDQNAVETEAAAGFDFDNWGGIGIQGIGHRTGSTTNQQTGVGLDPSAAPVGVNTEATQELGFGGYPNQIGIGLQTGYGSPTGTHPDQNPANNPGVGYGWGTGSAGLISQGQQEQEQFGGYPNQIGITEQFGGYPNQIGVTEPFGGYPSQIGITAPQEFAGYPNQAGITAPSGFAGYPSQIGIQAPAGTPYDANEFSGTPTVEETNMGMVAPIGTPTAPQEFEGYPNQIGITEQFEGYPNQIGIQEQEQFAGYPSQIGITAPTDDTTVQDTQKTVMPHDLSKTPAVIAHSIMDTSKQLDEEAKALREKHGLFSREYQEAQALANAFKELDAYSKAYSATNKPGLLSNLVGSHPVVQGLKSIEAMLAKHGIHSKKTGQDLLGVLQEAQRTGTLGQAVREMNGGGPSDQDIQGPQEVKAFIEKYPWASELDHDYILYLIANPQELQRLLTGEAAA